MKALSIFVVSLRKREVVESKSTGEGGGIGSELFLVWLGRSQRDVGRDGVWKKGKTEQFAPIRGHSFSRQLSTKTAGIGASKGTMFGQPHRRKNFEMLGKKCRDGGGATGGESGVADEKKNDEGFGGKNLMHLRKGVLVTAPVGMTQAGKKKQRGKGQLLVQLNKEKKIAWSGRWQAKKGSGKGGMEDRPTYMILSK